MTQALVGYTLSDTLIEDGGYALQRGQRDTDRQPVLVRRALSASETSLGRLRHEYAMRMALDPACCARPLLLQTDCLVLADPAPASRPLALTPGSALALPEFLRLGAALALALSQLHRGGVVHRDLRPSHILFDPASGVARLTGFGIAARIAPQQPAPAPDVRGDLYCIGVILYQMLTGGLPFGADATSWVDCHPPRELVPPHQRPGVDPTCSSIVVKLLSGSAEQRYLSAAGLYADLQHCRSMLEAQGRVEPFVLGCRDGAARVRAPHQLIGRGAELALLEQAAAGAATSHAPQLLLVSGGAGTGKSALLAALRQSDHARGAVLVSGKFEQRQRDIPYATLAKAFRDLVRLRIGQGEAALSGWRIALLASLGGNAGLVLELIPELRFVIGDHAPPQPLSAKESQGRFESVFCQFVGACASAGSALLLVLDDIQWIDPASLNLLSHLLSHPGVEQVLVIGAYRCEELDTAHPLVQARARLEAQGTLVREVALAGLERAQAAELVSAALGAPAQALVALADLVYRKTAGNPFFALQFLARLGESGLLRFDEAGGSWEWQADAIAARGFSDDVADLMVARLAQLPGGTLELVKLLACLGPDAGLDTIALVAGMSPLETDECLWPAARLGLVRREPAVYRFVHDRVQDAAYSMIVAATLPERHLHIGRTLLENAGEAGIDNQLFGIVHHLNQAREAISDLAELRCLARLNTLAGVKARNAIAYDSARDYFSQAARLLPPSDWQDEVDATFALYLALAECEYLCGHLDRAARLFSLLVEQARSRIDLARVALLRMALYQVSGRFDHAVTAGLGALELFGITFPDTPAAIAAALEDERQAIDAGMAGCRIADLYDECIGTDPEAVMVSALFGDLGSAVFSARPELYRLLAAKALNYTLRHGCTDSSCVTYSRYAVLLVSLGAIDDAFAFSELAQALAGRGEAPAKRLGRLHFAHGAYIHSWRLPIAGGVQQLEKSFLTCQENGDLPHAGYAAHIATWHCFESGAALEQTRLMARRYQGFARQQRNHVLFQLLRCYEQLAMCLQGETSEEGQFDDVQFRAGDADAVFERAGFGTARARINLMRQIAAYTFGDYDEALGAARAAADKLHFFLASINQASHHFYHALTMAALHPDAPPERQRVFIDGIRARLSMLRGWAGNCPANFQSRYLLLAAELARLEERNGDAKFAYDGAIAAARSAGFAQHAALAGELAAAWCRSRGAHSTALVYAQASLADWRSWGALGKVRAMQRRFPELCEPSVDDMQGGQ